MALHAGNVLGSVLGSVLQPHLPLRALFYISWGTTSLGMLCFALLPPSVHPAPPSLSNPDPDPNPNPNPNPNPSPSPSPSPNPNPNPSPSPSPNPPCHPSDYRACWKLVLQARAA